MFSNDNNDLSKPEEVSENISNETITIEQSLKHDILTQLKTKFKQTEAVAMIDDDSEFLSLGSMDVSNNTSDDLMSMLRKHQDQTLLANFINDLKAILQSYQGQDSQFQTILTKLCDFLDKQNLFYSRLNAPTVVLELMELILNPSLLHQKQTNLCGIASSLSLLIHTNPDYFVQLSLDLALHGQSNFFTLKPHHDAIGNEQSIAHALMSAIKNNYTKTGYSNYSLQLFEPLRGVTRPKEIVAVLRDFGFEHISEFMLITNKSNQQELSMIYRGILGGIYDKDHKSFAQRIDNLSYLQACLAKNQEAIMLINPALIIDLLPGQQSLESFSSPLEKINIESTHYIYLKNLSLDQTNNTIQFSFETCGKEFTQTKSINEFLDHYRGAITVEPMNLNKNLSLANKN